MGSRGGRRPIKKGEPRVEPTLTAIEMAGEWNEDEWLHSATVSPAFDFLRDPEEDIYRLTDGGPYHDET
jgi:hypothetical protein